MSTHFPLFPHQLKVENIAKCRTDENCCFNGGPDNEHLPEKRTLDSWAHTFFGMRDHDYDILFERIAKSVAAAVGQPYADVQRVTSDDLERMAAKLSEADLLEIWQKLAE